jgi:hypothetical protein
MELVSVQHEAKIEDSLDIDGFNAMLCKDNTYKVTAFYTSDAVLEIPDVNTEDTYTFDGSISDGWVSSKEPCIEYHYNFRTFYSQSDLKIDWVDFNISPTTYTVEEYQPGEYFILRAGDTYTKFETKATQ